MWRRMDPLAHMARARMLARLAMMGLGPPRDARQKSPLRRLLKTQGASLSICDTFTDYEPAPGCCALGGRWVKGQDSARGSGKHSTSRQPDWRSPTSPHDGAKSLTELIGSICFSDGRGRSALTAVWGSKSVMPTVRVMSRTDICGGYAPVIIRATR